MSDHGLAAAATNESPTGTDPEADAPTAAASAVRGAPQRTSMRTVLATLWHTSPDGERSLTFHLLPRGADPTLAVPARPLKVAAAALRRYKTPSSGRDRLRMQTLALGVRVGVAPQLLRWQRVRVTDQGGSATLVGHLEHQLGRPLSAAVAIGPPRQNRKPIVQLIGADGRTVAFAKVGVTDVTRDLVRREAIALQQVSAGVIPSLFVPEVLYGGQWQGTEVMVLSALPPASGERVPPSRRLAAMQEVARVAGVRERTYSGSGYRARLLADLSHSGAVAARLQAVADQLGSLGPAGELSLPFGAWHGDWAPWNMGAHDGRVMLWDWERFETDVPCGFDALHFELQRLIRVEGQAPRAAVTELCRRGAELLEPFDVPRAGAGLVTALYLLHIGARALQHEPDAASTKRGPIEGWLVPGLEQHVGELALGPEATSR
jgi:hypothetical protein